MQSIKYTPKKQNCKNHIEECKFISNIERIGKKYKYFLFLDLINLSVKNNSKVIAKEELITAFDLNKVPLLTYYLNNLKNIIIGNY